MKSCPNQKENLKDCSCTYDSCNKRGICCECVAYHRAQNQIPGCFFPPQIEKTYDRSFKCFISCFK